MKGGKFKKRLPERKRTGFRSGSATPQTGYRSGSQLTPKLATGAEALIDVSFLPGGSRSSDGPAHLIEAYFAHWLRVAGTDHVARFGFDAAMDHLWELLNAGLIRVKGDNNGFAGIVPCNPPDPPAQPMVRPILRGAGR